MTIDSIRQWIGEHFQQPYFYDAFVRNSVRTSYSKILTELQSDSEKVAWQELALKRQQEILKRMNDFYWK